MFAIETFERYAAPARASRETQAFVRATGAINDAADPLVPEGREAERVMAGLEALFLMLAPAEDDAAEAAFGEMLDAMTGGQIDEEQVEEIFDGFAEALEEEGLEIRLKSVAEVVREEPLFAAQVFKLCAAALAASRDVDDEDEEPAEEGEELLAAFADHLGLGQARTEALLAEVESALAG